MEVMTFFIFHIVPVFPDAFIFVQIGRVRFLSPVGVGVDREKRKEGEDVDEEPKVLSDVEAVGIEKGEHGDCGNDQEKDGDAQDYACLWLAC